ncbi:P-loop containing nucleoside triphosphate hydrolase protein [Lentinus brumalis]|uniref:DNA 3'-5' helicase n=1 Tax=Lentinus brumalis TaxID=2498619 RepID=A0A371CZ81_9APHY|nr:P-loop containing nucleoside triphosphate hydrolase protein [Polyporus brumalis]
MSSVGARFTFSSPDGYQLIRDIVRERLPYVPHDYQLDGVCKLLDGLDLVAVIPTGAGKTSYYVVYMLMLLELSKNPALAAGAKVPADPCMVMVYPTNGLEEEQAGVFEQAGITALVLNANTLSLGRRGGQDLWKGARTGVSVLLLSPEQLASPGFEGLLQHGPFQRRLCALGVDEIHLLYSWGQVFRQAFRQLGYVRARMSLHTRMIGTTATLLAGHPEDTILRFLGLRRGEFHLIRRSNLRRNVRTIFRTLTHGLGGWSFADLRWILTSGRKTVIHCRTIAQGFRLAIFLWKLAPPLPDRHVRIRTYNALNWPSYNTRTRELMRDDPNAQIIIATASFMVGIDLPNIADVVILGNLLNADEHVQWEGRAGRDPRAVADARCITYVTPKVLETARGLCAGEAPRAQKASGGKKATTVQMELAAVPANPTFMAFSLPSRRSRCFRWCCTLSPRKTSHTFSSRPNSITFAASCFASFAKIKYTVLQLGVTPTRLQ